MGGPLARRKARLARRRLRFRSQAACCRSARGSLSLASGSAGAPQGASLPLAGGSAPGLAGRGRTAGRGDLSRRRVRWPPGNGGSRSTRMAARPPARDFPLYRPKQPPFPPATPSPDGADRREAPLNAGSRLRGTRRAVCDAQRAICEAPPSLLRGHRRAVCDAQRATCEAPPSRLRRAASRLRGTAEPACGPPARHCERSEPFAPPRGAICEPKGEPFARLGGRAICEPKASRPTACYRSVAAQAVMPPASRTPLSRSDKEARTRKRVSRVTFSTSIGVSDSMAVRRASMRRSSPCCTVS
jgi:hypothetical protein